MSTLYELTGIYQQIYDLDMDDETKQDTLDSIDWNEDYENKVEGYIKVIKILMQILMPEKMKSTA